MKNILDIKKYTCFLLKPSILDNSFVLKAKESIEKFGYHICASKKIYLEEDDVLGLYVDELEDNLKSENGDIKVSIMKEYYMRTLLHKECMVILATHNTENATQYATKIKSDAFVPKDNSKEKLRYILRDIKYDKFDYIKDPVTGFYTNIPMDNVIHSPSTLSEYSYIVEKWFPEFL